MSDTRRLTDEELADIMWSAENWIGRVGVGVLVTRSEVLALVAEVRASRASRDGVSREGSTVKGSDNLRANSSRDEEGLGAKVEALLAGERARAHDEGHGHVVQAVDRLRAALAASSPEVCGEGCTVEGTGRLDANSGALADAPAALAWKRYEDLRSRYASACERMGMAHANGTRAEWEDAAHSEVKLRLALNALVRALVAAPAAHETVPECGHRHSVTGGRCVMPEGHGGFHVCCSTSVPSPAPSPTRERATPESESYR